MRIYIILLIIVFAKAYNLSSNIILHLFTGQEHGVVCSVATKCHNSPFPCFTTLQSGLSRNWTTGVVNIDRTQLRERSKALMLVLASFMNKKAFSLTKLVLWQNAWMFKSLQQNYMCVQIERLTDLRETAKSVWSMSLWWQ